MKPTKTAFKREFKKFVQDLAPYANDKNDQWAIKGFIDIYRNIYVISSDTKIISKIIEIHLLPKMMEFADAYNYRIVLADHQNYYPDISFVKADNEKIKFAVDFKTTYRLPDKPHLCNGFTLGSHGKYFTDRNSTKNIQFPYNDYLGHYCLGVIYTRGNKQHITETKKYTVQNIKSITSVASQLQFFVAEKWRIASDKGGSGNTANIGSINNINDIINEKGMFYRLGESWFDDYWANYNKISMTMKDGGMKKINSLVDFVKYRKGDVSRIVPKRR